MRRIGWISLVLSCCLLFLSACATAGGGDRKQGANGKDDFSAGMVTDTGGLNDESFNQTTYEGLKRAQKELGIDIKALESKRDEDYVPNLTKFAREGRDMVWGVGFKFDKAISDVANQFQNVQFGIVDSDLGGKIPKNVTAVTFKEEEGSFLMGVIAGLTTKTNKVGFIGGISSPLIKKFEVGYRAGVLTVNPKAKVQVAYAESFNDVTKGRSLAKAMYDGGADIIYHAAGGVGKGLFDEVKSRKKGKYWAIGVDMDQSRLAPDHTLSSMIKKVDVAVYNVMKAQQQKKHQAGKVLQFGLKENGVGYAETTKRHVKPDVLKRVDEYKRKIANKELVVPTSEADLHQFIKS
ncbi:BMP family lipoprotein [Laceyella putida]|uniref:BMP family protein n=1 Tax=Laceyella putida TaxID=110101 RepID=A0ABW2RKP1_9BACL